MRRLSRKPKNTVEKWERTRQQMQAHEPFGVKGTVQNE